MIYRNKNLEIESILRSIAELNPYCLMQVYELSWFFENQRIELPFRWEERDSLVEFTCEFCLPAIHELEDFYLRAWFGGESLLIIDDNPFGEINEYHREVSLNSFCDGKKHTITVQTVPRGLKGNKTDKLFKEAYIVKYDGELKRYINMLINIAECARSTKDKYNSATLINILTNNLAKIDIPRSTNVYLSSLAENQLEKIELEKVWNPPTITGCKGLWNKEARNHIKYIVQNIKQNLKSVENKLLKQGNVYLSGHAHIDYAWLWPVEETKRKIIRTFSNALQLAKKYKDFIFIQSSAQMYVDVKETFPTLFKEIKQLVGKGQWEPVGGMWVESDCNIPSVESLIRQFYYGQSFFENEFGKISKVAWLPDVFGFSWVLPQILKESGINYFVTTKLNWNESNEFPYDICRWIGIDKSEVIYYSFRNDEFYNGTVSSKTVLDTWNNFRQKQLTDKVFYTFGYGDGGGGPTEEMIHNYYSLRELPGIPKIEFSSVENFFENILKDLTIENLPAWDGELYLELHRGTLTSQSITKRLHKKAEEALRVAELLNVLLDANYQYELDELWKVLLRNEFHDILPGSSIREVYETANKELSQILDECNKINNKILEPYKTTKDKITIFNPSSFKQKVVFIYNYDVSLKLNNRILNKLKTYDGNFIYISDSYINPLQMISIDVINLGETNSINSLYDDINQKKNFKIEKFESGYRVENRKIIVDIFNDGTIQIFNKVIRRYAFNHRGNLLALYKDIPFKWDNWDIDYNTHFSEKILNCQNITIIEDNYIRKVLKIYYKIESSIIEQFYIIEYDSEIVDVKTRIDWHLRRTVLKVKFPTNIVSRSAKYDLDGGYTERSTHQNTNIDKAKYEVLAHRWVDLSQYDFGLSIINDGKYGHSVKESTIYLTLLKTGIYPDFYSDEGYHELSYCIYLHGSCDVKEIIQRADTYNKKIMVFDKSIVNSQFHLDILNDSFKLLSYRKLDTKKIVRICEVVGSSGIVDILPKFSFNKVFLTDLLEKNLKELKVHENKISLEYKPFKIYTIMFYT